VTPHAWPGLPSPGLGTEWRGWWLTSSRLGLSGLRTDSHRTCAPGTVLGKEGIRRTRSEIAQEGTHPSAIRSNCHLDVEGSDRTGRVGGRHLWLERRRGDFALSTRDIGSADDPAVPLGHAHPDPPGLA